MVLCRSRVVTGGGRPLLVLRGRPSSFPWLLGGGGGSPPGFPGFEFPGSGEPDLEGVLGGAGALPLISVSVGWVVVPLIFGAGPSPGVLRKWSIFRGLGRGVSPFLGVFPVGYLPGNLSALGVYGGGRPLIYTGRSASRWDTSRVLWFFVGLLIVRVVGYLLQLLAVLIGWWFRNVPRIVWLGSELRGLLLILILGCRVLY